MSSLVEYLGEKVKQDGTVDLSAVHSGRLLPSAVVKAVISFETGLPVQNRRAAIVDGVRHLRLCALPAKELTYPSVDDLQDSMLGAMGYPTSDQPKPVTVA